MAVQGRMISATTRTSARTSMTPPPVIAVAIWCASSWRCSSVPVPAAANTTTRMPSPREPPRPEAEFPGRARELPCLGAAAGRTVARCFRGTLHFGCISNHSINFDVECHACDRFSQISNLSGKLGVELLGDSREPSAPNFPHLLLLHDTDAAHAVVPPSPRR